MTTSRLWLLTLVCATALARPLFADQPTPEREKRVPGCLCVPAVSPDDFKNRFDEATRRRWDDSYAVYRKWLQHVEVLEFFGNSEENQTFLTSVRNVTPDDEVFLRVRRANPLLYTYTLEIKQDDTPEEDLLTIAGSGITTINPFIPTEQTTKENEDTGNVQPETGNERSQGQTHSAREIVTAMREASPGKTDAHWNALTKKVENAPRLFKDSYDRLDDARREQKEYFGSIAELRRDVSKLIADVQALADTVQAIENNECFTSKPCSTEEIRKVLWDEGPGKVLEEVLARHDKLARRIAELSVPPAVLQQQLEATELALENAKDILRREGATNDEIAKLPDISLITGGIERVRAKNARMVTELNELQTALTTQRTKLQTLRQSLALDASRAGDADVCLSLGRFAAQKTITVTVNLKKRPQPETPKQPNRARLTELARNLLAEIEKGGDGSASAKTAAAIAKKDDGDGEEEEEGEKSAEEPTPSVTTTTATAKFSVLRPIHVQTTLGYGVSFLAAPTFDFKSRTIDEVKADDGTVITPAMKEITPFAENHNERQLLPMVQFGLHIKPRYPFAGADASPNESIRPWHRWIPFPTLGFALSSPTDNYFLGGGLNLSRGVVAVAGAHFGKVKRLVSGKAEDTAFTIPAIDDFDIDDIVDEGIRTRFFFAITIDSSAIGKLFSAAGTGDNGGEEGEKKK